MTIDTQNVISTIQSSVFNFIGGAAGFLKDFTFVIILMIFFLSEAGGFSRKIVAIRRVNGPDFAAFSATAKDVQKYLGIKTLVINCQLLHPLILPASITSGGTALKPNNVRSIIGGTATIIVIITAA